MTGDGTGLRIAIDARVRDPSVGGVQQVLMGLASGLSELRAPDEYLFLLHEDAAGWLLPFLKGPCRPLLIPAPPGRRAAVKRITSSAPVKALRSSLGRALRRFRGIPHSDGTIERAGVDLVHFVRQEAFLTEVPSIYQPHDLQHVHFPEFFTPGEWTHRDRMYRTFCEQAERVVAMTEFGARDIESAYRVPREKIVAVPWAPATDLYGPSAATAKDVVRDMGLPEKFVFFPSQTWPHKNHLALLEALAFARDDLQTEVFVVFTGSLTSHYRDIRKAIERLGLEDQVAFLGFIDEEDLMGLYRSTTGVVFPSLFEGWGMPVAEAMKMGAPVACSHAACLPEIVGDAALLFDPTDPEDIGRAVTRLWTDGDLRKSLVLKGRDQVANLSWQRTAAEFRRLYHEIATTDRNDAGQRW